MTAPDYDAIFQSIQAAKDRPPQPNRGAGPDYDAIFQSIQAAKARPPASVVQARAANASLANPDIEAEKQVLARRLKSELGEDWSPMAIDPTEARRRLGIAANEKLLADSPTLARTFTDKDFAATTHDDLAQLSGIEKAIRYLVSAPNAPRGGLAADGWLAVRSMFSALPKVNAGAYNFLAAPFEMVGLDSIGGALRGQARREEQTATAWQGLSPDAGFTEQAIMSGFQSAGQNLAMLPLGLAQGGTRLMLGAMGAITGGQTYGKARDEGLNPLQSAAYGLQDAVAEVVGERFFGAAGFLKQVKAGASTGKLFAYELFREVPGEVGTTLWQNFNEWGHINPDKSLKEFLAEQPEAVVQTVISTLVGGATQIGAVKAADRALSLVDGRLQRAQQAEQSAQVLGQLAEFAKASKSLERDPLTVANFVQTVAEEQGVEVVFVPAQVLMQSGLAEQAAAVLPSVAAQLQVAAQTGGNIAIPVGEYLAGVAKTELDAQLREMVRFDPNGYSRAEAQVYMQSHAADLQAEVERALGGQKDIDAFKASQEAVKQQVLTELNTRANRFTPDVNEVYATLIAARTGVRAAQLGMTPEQFFEKQRLAVQAQGVMGEGDVLAQSKFLEAVAKAKETIRGVLGQLKSDKRNTSSHSLMPLSPVAVAEAAAHGLNLTGFSHAIDGSAIRHTFKSHGNPKSEAARGQIAITDADIEMIPEIVSMPDKTIYGLKNDIGRDMVVYLKSLPDGTTLYLEEVRTGAKTLTTQSMRRYPQTTSAASIVEALRPTSETLPGDAFSVIDRPAARNGSYNQGPLGTFAPDQNLISLLKGANLSTFLHETGHYFFENDLALAAELMAQSREGASLSRGEQDILRDVSTLLTQVGITGPVSEQINAWYGMSFEERRGYHERIAESFELYLFEGKAPSIELEHYFQRFRAFMIAVYRSIKDFIARNPQGGQLTDEVRAVFDRMLATTEQIQLAEQAKSMLPLFESAQQAGMTIEEFAAYQALGMQQAQDAIQELQSRALRDLAWARNMHGREVKKLQKQAAARRQEVRLEVRREVMSRPVYRAWAFLTGKLQDSDKLTPETRKSDPNTVDPEADSLLMAIAKLGGLARESARRDLGVHEDDHRHPSGVFGKPVFRKEGGLDADTMAESLAELGYLSVDEQGQHSLHDLEDLIAQEIKGTPHYSLARDYRLASEQRAGEGVNLDALGAQRLDLGELKVMGLPAEIVERLQNLKMTARNGIHPDLLAEPLGFTSGDEMVRALAQATPPNEEIEGLTDRAMLERYGDLATPAAIERAADKAIHNEVRARLVATEANALVRAVNARRQTGTDRQGRPVTRAILPEAARAFAQQMVARLQIRNIRPGQYSAAQARAAKEAAAARQKGDLDVAIAEKRNELIQTYATRAAYEAQEEVEKGLRFLRKFNTEGTRKGLSSDYLEQIDELLARFELRDQSLKAIDRKTSLQSWIESQRAMGLEPEIPPALVEEVTRTHYKNLTLEEFRGVVDTVKQIAHLGRLKEKLLTAQEQREYAAVRDEIVQGIEANAKGRKADTRTPTTNLGRALDMLKSFGAAHIRAATWARIFDGGKDGGPVWEYFIRPANQRADWETTERAKATRALTEILAPVFKLGKMGGKGVFFPSLGVSLNREARLAIALNTGNAGNLQRLLGGEGWTVQQIQPVLQSLTAVEWQAVQAIWDHFETYRPQIAAKEMRVYGKEPNWVEPTPLTVTTADGQQLSLRGGYYPVKYDPAASQRAEEHADAEDARRQLQGAYTSATTRRSFTKARAEEVTGRPLLYTLGGVYSGVTDVIHDLAWHEWLIDANRLLRSQSIDAAIRTHYGPHAKQQLKTWVQAVAEGERGAANAGDAVLNRLRQGVSAAGLGFNIMSAAMQPLGLTQSVVRVGAHWVGKGTAQYLANPIALTRQVNEASEFMRNRAMTRLREINELRNRVQDANPALTAVHEGAYFLMARTQQVVDVITWQAAYEKATADGQAEERASALADQAVIDAQGGGQTKDLAGIERGSPAMKLFTTFYSFMGTAFNLGVSQTMTARSKGRLAADYLLLYSVPAVLGAMLKQALTPGGDDEWDLEKLLPALAAAQVEYLMGMMVVVREFSDAATTVMGVNEHVRDYGGPAGLRVVGDIYKMAQQVNQGEFDDAFRKAAINLVGSATGLPAAQVNRTLSGIKALDEGDTRNPAAVVFGYQR